MGAGGIARSHLRAFSDEAGVKAVAIADPNEAAARERADEFAIPSVYSDYRQLLEQDDVDAVILCVPNFLHAPISIESMAAGKHVLCEKPMALSIDEAERMEQASKDYDRVFALGLNHRYRTEVQQLRQLIADGKLGRVYHARTGLLRQSGIPGWGSWFTQKERSGGGPLIDLGVHMLDAVWYLAGTPRPLRVSGITHAELGPHGKGRGRYGKLDPNGIFDVEDLATALIRCEGGITIVVEVSWATHGPSRNWIELMGTEAGAIVGKAELQLFSESEGNPVEKSVPTPGPSARHNMLTHFASCIRSGEKPISNATDGVWLTRILDAIYRSAAAGEEVSV